MELTLKKPVIFFDLETTGTDVVHDRIVEISTLKVSPNGSEEVITYRINPGIPIPAEATAVHGITDKDVADKPLFKQYAKALAKYIEGCDLAGFNSSRFDIPMLAEEFARAEVDVDFSRIKMIDVQVIFHRKEPRTLEAAYRFYCNRELKDPPPHSAEGDTRATYEVLKSQLDKYEDLPRDIETLAQEYSAFNNNVDLAGRIIKNEQGREIFNFGKHKGKLVEEILKTEPSFYDWMMKADFPLNTKQTLTRLYTQYKARLSGGNVKVK